MINLIPLEAKKQLVKEYWVRTGTVWCLLWSAVLVVGMITLAPTYMLIKLQTNAYAQSAQTATERNQDFDALAKELKEASERASTMSNNFSTRSASFYLALLKTFETEAVGITKITLADKDAPIELSGVAKDRQSLAAFRDALIAHETIEAVDLPISSLAKDRDITFDMTVTITPQE